MSQIIERKLSYSELLKDSRWQRKRLEILSARDFECQNCGARGETSEGTCLHIHHAYYRRSVKPWDYPDDCYQCLCEACHDLAEEKRQSIQEMLFTHLPSDLEILERAIAVMIPNFQGRFIECCDFITQNTEVILRAFQAGVNLNPPFFFQRTIDDEDTHLDEMREIYAALYALGNDQKEFIEIVTTFNISHRHWLYSELNIRGCWNPPYSTKEAELKLLEMRLMEKNTMTGGQ